MRPNGHRIRKRDPTAASVTKTAGEVNRVRLTFAVRAPGTQMGCAGGRFASTSVTQHVVAERVPRSNDIVGRLQCLLWSRRPAWMLPWQLPASSFLVRYSSSSPALGRLLIIAPRDNLPSVFFVLLSTIGVHTECAQLWHAFFEQQRGRIVIHCFGGARINHIPPDQIRGGYRYSTVLRMKRD